MGALNSCCIPHGQFERSPRSSTPKEKGHRRNLSATFNMSVLENTSSTQCGLVDINTANEEELMTLPGVNRMIAKKIVDYRIHIGRFRCVEDVALTPGVGAAKLAIMRDDIFVDSPEGVENVEGTLQSAPQIEKGSESPSAVCVNSANIFNLLRVKGIGMTIAKNIVVHREKYGKYTQLDDLLKVKGIDLYNLEIMRPFLTVEDKSQKSLKIDDGKNGSCMNGATGNKIKQEALDREYVRKSTSSLENLLQILGPLAQVPERPKVDKITSKYKNRDTLRLASWNLDKFSLEKSSNPGVKDVVCMTLLENGFGLVAVQDIMDKEALCEICRELNSPTLPNVRKWSGQRGQWACVVSETASDTHLGGTYQGFLYDKSQNIELIKSSLLKGVLATQTSSPLVATFKIKQGLTFAAVSVHRQSADLTDDHVQGTQGQTDDTCDILSKAKQQLTDVETIIVLGELNQVSHLQGESYLSCIPSEAAISGQEKSSGYDVSCGNIWISQGAKDLYTGVSGVVRDGLSSTWIPRGWSWSGVVSNSCPVYALIYSSHDDDKLKTATFY